MPDGASPRSFAEELAAKAAAEKARRTAMGGIKEAAEGDLLEFIRLFWRVLEPEKKLIEGWLLELLADVLMAVTDGHLTRVNINVPPGSGKSQILNIFWPAWEWGPQNLAHLRYLSASYSTSVPERDNIRFTRLINDPVYRQLWGDRVHLVRQGTEVVENHRTGWKRVTSTGGSITGLRGDRLLLDDLNNPFNVESEDVREATVRFVREIMPDRLNDLTKSAIINLQQRTHEKDASGTLMEFGSGYEFVCVPMEFDPLRIFPVTLRRNEDGTPAQTWTDPRALDENGNLLEGLFTNARGEKQVRMGSPMARAQGALCWPERFTPDAVAKLKAEKGPYAWSCNPGDAPILMWDQTSKALSEICVGDVVTGFGFRPQRPAVAGSGRHYLAPAVVTDIHRSVLPVVRVTMESSRVIRCTANHLWGDGTDDAKEKLKYSPVALGRRLIPIAPEYRAGISPLSEIPVLIEPCGEEAVYGLTTETGNYVVWGLASSNSQYDQFPGVRGGGIIRKDWWRIWPSASYPELGTIIVALDTAVEENANADFNACTAWGAFAGESGEPQLLLLEAWRERLPLAQLIEQVERTCRRRKADFLLIEHKTRGRDVHDELARLYASATWATILVKPEGSKASRLKAVEHLFSGDYRKDPASQIESWSGGIVFAPDKEWADDVINEVASYPYGAHDDYSDTVSLTLGWVRKNGVMVRKVEYEEEKLRRQQFHRPMGLPYTIGSGR